MSQSQGALRATAFEYNHRYLVHGLVYTLGFAAPWHRPLWDFLRNGSSWFMLANLLAKPTYQRFAFDWNSILVGITVFALAGAGLRVWGAAYLGMSTVHRGGMEGDRVIADGPYRFVRNPLYLGTILHTVAVAMLMRPEAGLLTLGLIILLQFRLIGREEPYLAEQRGAAYLAYKQLVPRLIPSLRARVPAGGAHAQWGQGVLSEIYMLGVALTLATLGWSTGYAWESTILHIMQGIVISLGLSLVARALFAKR